MIGQIFIRKKMIPDSGGLKILQKKIWKKEGKEGRKKSRKEGKRGRRKVTME